MSKAWAQHGVGTLLAVGFACASASAGDPVNWTNPLGGDFSDGMNWSTGAPPTSGDQARFNQFGTYSVNFAGAAALDQMRLDAGAVTLELNGATFVVLNPVLSLLMSATTGQMSDLTIRGGVFMAPDVLLAFSSLSEAGLTVDGAGAMLSVSDELIVGRSGEASITVTNGASVSFVTSASLASMAGANAEAFVSGMDSTLTGSGPLLIGEEFGGSTASLLITDSGICSATNAVIGRASTLAGDSMLMAPVVNNGTVSPGAIAEDLDTLTIDGAYEQASTGELVVEINESGEDLLHVTGDVTLAGDLRVELLDSYLPPGGTKRVILTTDGSISGDFDDVTLNGAVGTLDVMVQISNGVVEALFVADSGQLGDITGDGVVNALDIATLLSFWGTDNEAADQNDSGNVDAADLAIVIGNWTL